MRPLSEARVFFAHSAGTDEEWEPMARHVNWVADLAARNGEPFGAHDESRFTAILHDLGKYGDRFQGRLRGIENHIDHWSAGAFEAVMKGERGFAAALAIQGHHIGLQRGDRNSLAALNIRDLLRSHPFGRKLSDDDHQSIKDRAQADGFTWDSAPESCFDWKARDRDPVGQMLAVRMLFSTLVDADFVATERHFAGTTTSSERRDAIALNAPAARSSLQSYIGRIATSSTSAPGANEVRSALLEMCIRSGGGPRGMFTLNAPTGSGKTLAMLAWALEHCIQHSQISRIIVVLPYLTILEQTARVYREGLAGWLPDELRSRAILEHHSLASWKSVPAAAQSNDEQDAGNSSPRFLAENWDAPIVVTSSVQFLESLFANSPSACRKLHRIANSVILMDEVQTLSSSIILPTLGALSTLVNRFRCSVVLATATQPAFSHLEKDVLALASAGFSAEPIVPDPKLFFSRMRRTSVHWPLNKEESISWHEIASRMMDGGQALCIVNLKRHAQALFDVLRQRQAEGVSHLSTSMCPDHRSAVLDDVREKLKSRRPCLLVATQCVEAGVDLDFPTVFRSFAPLDSIAQAAGRCNRNGNLLSGEVRVFRPEKSGSLYPDGSYAQAALVTDELLEKHEGALDIDDPAVFDEYFRSLYNLGRPEARSPELRDAIKALDFVKVAELYKIIDQGSISIVTPWRREGFEKLATEIRGSYLTRSWIRRARGITVSAFRPRRDAAEWTHLEPVPTRGNKVAVDWFLLKDGGDYDSATGLRIQSGLAFMEG